jgi:hypothetical protein
MSGTLSSSYNQACSSDFSFPSFWRIHPQTSLWLCVSLTKFWNRYIIALGNRKLNTCTIIISFDIDRVTSPYSHVSKEWSRRSRKGRGSFFIELCRTLMSHSRQPFSLAAADALLATSWRRRTRQDVSQKASRRSLAAQIDFNFRFRDRLSFISLLDATIPSPSNSLLVVP